MAVADQRTVRLKAHNEHTVEDKTTSLQKVVSACMGALMTSLLMNPLDVVKVKLQAQNTTQIAPCWNCGLFPTHMGDHIVGGKHCEPGAVSVPRLSAHRALRDFAQTFMHIVRHEGVRGLYAGLQPTLIMAVPSTVVYFTCYDELKEYFEGRNLPRYVAPIVAGVTARSLATTVISPLELIRTNMQANRMVARTLWGGAKTVVKQSGVRGLFAGLSPTLMRDVPFSALYWIGLEEVKLWLQQIDPRPGGTQTFLHAFIAGAASGSVAATVTIPFDVIKTKRQVFFFTKPASRTPEDIARYATTMSTYRHVVETEGVAGLFAGLVPRVARVAPACAIMISCYELGKWWFNGASKEANELDSAYDWDQ